jgi:hypothetical protein
MSTARLRKAFRYPEEGDPNDPQEGIDEEGIGTPIEESRVDPEANCVSPEQEKLIQQLATEDDEKIALYTVGNLKGEKRHWFTNLRRKSFWHFPCSRSYHICSDSLMSSLGQRSRLHFSAYHHCWRRHTSWPSCPSIRESEGSKVLWSST